MTIRTALAGAIAIAFIPGGIYAAQTAVKPKSSTKTPSGEQPKKKPKQLSIRAAAMEHVEATNTDDLKNAVITDLEEGTIFRADKVKIDNVASAKTADATGNLQVTDKQADLTGETLKVYFAKAKRLAVVTGSVTILVKPKSEQKDPTTHVAPMPVTVQGGTAKVEAPAEDEENGAGGARKVPATITCDKLEYEYAKEKKHALLTGNFKIVQKFPDHIRTIFADHAEYFGPEDRVVLYPPVRWEDTKNNQKGSTPDKVEVYTKEGDERLKATNFEITQDQPEEDDEQPAGGKPGQKPPDTKSANGPDDKALPPKQPTDKKTP
jgi:lipopolysaccharide export system protein LptA